MYNKNLIIVFICLCFTSQSILAKKRFFSLQVKAREDGSLVDALKSSTDLPPQIYKKKGFINMIKRYNPKLRKKDKVKKGEKIYIEMPYNTAMYYAKLEKPLKTKPEDKNYDYSFSYSFSRKNIIDTELSGNEEIIESDQNAPLTIGFAAKKTINDRYAFFSTIYFSRMNDADFKKGTTEDSIIKVPVPLEIALKTYVQRKFDNTKFQLYGGLDIERLTTFKTDQDDIARLRHSFAFLTLGIQRPFSIFQFPSLFKFSIARSIINKLSLDSNKPVDFETFSGNKIASLLIVSITNRIGIHSFFDWHKLEAESELDMKRYGMGLHFRF